jgi:predicted acetyltransferase
VPDVGQIRLLSVGQALRHLPAVWTEFARTTPGVFGRSEAGWRDEVLDDAAWRRQGAGMRWRVVVREGRATVTRTDADPDATLGIAALGPIYLGGVRATDLARAGHLAAVDPATWARIDVMHVVSRQPWCPAIL